MERRVAVHFDTWVASQPMRCRTPCLPVTPARLPISLFQYYSYACGPGLSWFMPSSTPSFDPSPRISCTFLIVDELVLDIVGGLVGNDLVASVAGREGADVIACRLVPPQKLHTPPRTISPSFLVGSVLGQLQQQGKQQQLKWRCRGVRNGGFQPA